jgi:hypothetical protein
VKLIQQPLRPALVRDGLDEFFPSTESLPPPIDDFAHDPTPVLAPPSPRLRADPHGLRRPRGWGSEAIELIEPGIPVARIHQECADRDDQITRSERRSSST